MSSRALLIGLLLLAIGGSAVWLSWWFILAPDTRSLPPLPDQIVVTCEKCQAVFKIPNPGGTLPFDCPKCAAAGSVWPALKCASCGRVLADKASVDGLRPVCPACGSEEYLPITDAPSLPPPAK